MPTTAEYLTNLRTATNEAARLKKEALQNALTAYTTADVASLSDPDYKKFKFGQKGPGSRDVQYMQQFKNAEAGAEGAGVLASGQYATTLASQLAQYKGDIGSQTSKSTAEQNLIDAETAQKLAEYEATYGTGTTTGGGGTNAGGAGGAGGPKDSSVTPQDSSVTSPPVYRQPEAGSTPATSTANLPSTYKAQDMAQYAPKQTPPKVTSNLPSGYKPPGATVIKKPAVPAKPPTKSLTGVRYK